MTELEDDADESNESDESDEDEGLHDQSPFDSLNWDTIERGAQLGHRARARESSQSNFNGANASSSSSCAVDDTIVRNKAGGGVGLVDEEEE